MLTPNLFAWYAMVSKFSADIRKSWPKGKAPAASGQAEESKGEPKGKGQGPKGGDQSKKNAGKGGKK